MARICPSCQMCKKCIAGGTEVEYLDGKPIGWGCPVKDSVGLRNSLL